MCVAPSIVPEVGYRLCLPRFHLCVSQRGLSIPQRTRGVKYRAVHFPSSYNMDTE